MTETLENEFLRFTFDSSIINLTELTNKKTGDNYIKCVQNHPILSLWCLSGHEKVHLTPSGVTLKAKQGRLEIHCDTFAGKGTELPIQAEATLEIGGDCMLKGSVSLENHSPCDIVEIMFPHIRGIWLGESWKDDTIIYPHHAGEKTDNPVEVYTSERYLSFTRANTFREDGVYVREINYCGLASMMWMYYYDHENGFYISSNDREFLVTGMRVETGGPGDPWMGFGIRKFTRIASGGSWASGAYILAVNCEDWHWGARTYRKWIEPFIGVDNPSFLQDEFALNQCYNFKKDGLIHNRFEDIPRMYDTGEKYRMKHMFIASWNRRGFDCNYPEYYPDMDLGTSMDLYEGCRYVNQKGGFVTFYINSRIFDTGSDFYPTLGHDMAIKKPDGDIYKEQYDGTSVFAVMCPSDRKWRKLLADTACWMVKSYGATGIYLDQLGSAEPFACYDASHSHRDIGEFNKGYLQLIRELIGRLRRINPRAFLMIENCGDIYGRYIWGSLTWNGDPYDEYFNVFKYTFPEYVQVNMVNPRSYVPEEERETAFYRDMESATLLGAVFWLGVTCRFTGNEEKFRKYAEKAIEFRAKLNPFIRDGVYCDDEGITFRSKGIRASSWQLKSGGRLYIVGNASQLEGCRFAVRSETEPGKVVCEDVEGGRLTLGHRFNNGELEFRLSSSRLLYVLIEN